MFKSVFRRPKMAVIRFVHCLGLPVEDNTLVLASYIPLILTYTDRLVCGAGSVKRYGVRPSVRPTVCSSMCPQQQTRSKQQTRCCRFAVVSPAGSRYRSIAARLALSSKCKQCHVAR